MPDRTYTQEELDDRLQQARTAQQTHDVKGVQQTRMSAEILAQAVVAAMPQKAGLPGWVTATAAIGGLFITGATVMGIIWSMAIRPVESRLDALEKVDVAYLATNSALSSRMSAAENKIAQIETTIATAGRIRDQQAQGVADQVRGLLQSDQEAAKRLEQQSNIIASILPRLEEILRRQERLENRLGANRVQPNRDDSPAYFDAAPFSRHPI